MHPNVFIHRVRLWLRVVEVGYCFRCHQALPLAHFWPPKRSCKECERVYQNAQRRSRKKGRIYRFATLIRGWLSAGGYGYCTRCHTVKTTVNFCTSNPCYCKACIGSGVKATRAKPEARAAYNAYMRRYRERVKSQ